MERVVIGLEDEVSGGTGVDWTIERALSKELRIRVVGVLDEVHAGRYSGRAVVRVAGGF